MKLGNKLRNLLWTTPRVLNVVRWQGDQIANEIDTLEAELARLRPLAEAAEKLSAEDITSLVKSIEFTRMRIVSEPITKKLHALAEALEALENET